MTANDKKEAVKAQQPSVSWQMARVAPMGKSSVQMFHAPT
jgi:hypothetical protein